VAAPGNLKFAETLPRGNLPPKKMAMPPSLMLVIVAFSFWPSPDPSVAGICHRKGLGEVARMTSMIITIKATVTITSIVMPWRVVNPHFIAAV
jgi:hypothetical protein